MKTAIVGYSGSGKSTLARAIGAHDGASILHLDSVHYLPGWEARKPEEERQIVSDFLDRHDAWVIDGNYSKLSYDRRMEEADRIIVMRFDRLNCLRRVTRRYRTYRGRTRPDLAEGCCEKLDREFVLWVLWKGRKKAARQRYRRLQEQYADKVTVLKNQKQTDAFLAGLGSTMRG